MTSLSLEDSTSIAIVGGGIIGLSIGWYLTKTGRDVVLFEEGVCGRDASWASAGILSVHIENDPATGEISDFDKALLSLESRSYELWKEFGSELRNETGIDFGYRLNGSMRVAFEQEEARKLESDFKLQKELGLRIDWLSKEEALDLEPRLSPNLLAATLSRMDGQVEPREVIRALREAFTMEGGLLREHSPVNSVRIDGGKVTGLEVGNDIIKCDSVVIAAGAWSSQISGIPSNSRPDIVPAKGQIMSLKMDPNSDLLEHTVFGRQGYYIPRVDNRLVIGATIEEAGFDTSNTASGISLLLSRAMKTLPFVRDLPIVEMWAGLRPFSPDRAPILGPTDVNGLVMATGHSMIGVILAPITANCITQYLTRGTITDDMQTFSIERFKTLSN